MLGAVLHVNVVPETALEKEMLVDDPAQNVGDKLLNVIVGFGFTLITAFTVLPVHP